MTYPIAVPNFAIIICLNKEKIYLILLLCALRRTSLLFLYVFSLIMLNLYVPFKNFSHVWAFTWD